LWSYHTVVSETQLDPVVIGRDLAASILGIRLAQPPHGRDQQVLDGLGALARCRALLIGMCDLVDAGRADVVGVLGRALFETSVFGTLSLFAETADLKAIHANWLYWQRDLAEKLEQPWPGAESDQPWGDDPPIAPKRYALHSQCQRLGELLHQCRGEDPGGPLAWYHQFYAFESRNSAHGSPASTSRYLEVNDGQPVRLLLDPPPGQVDAAALGLAVTLTALLAEYICEVLAQPLVTTEVTGLAALRASDAVASITAH
jgi:hypothetical protein